MQNNQSNDRPPLFNEPFQMPPPITSMFDRKVTKSIDQDDFVVINDRVMLPQEAVAKLFDMSVEDIMRAIQFLYHKDWRVQAVIWRNGRYYFPTADSMTAILEVSPYREAGYDPNFLRMVFDETQKDLVTDKVYYQPERSAPTSRKDRSNTFIISIIAILLIGFFSLNSSADKKQSPPSNPPPAVETQTVETKPVETKPPTPAPVPQNKFNYRGRGLDTVSELDYVGYQGYIGIDYRERCELIDNATYPYTPWQVPTYERDKQFWAKTDITLEHKTPIVVREQFINQDKRYDPYKGYLLVERTSDGAQFYIDVRNFILKPYWDSSIESALNTGCVLVEYHQRSDYWPVTKEDKKNVPPEGSIFIALDTIGTLGKGWVQNSRHQIFAFSSDYGGICFNKADLTIIY